MKKFAAFIFFILLAVAVNGQFKEDANNKLNIREGFLDPAATSNLFGFINPDNFSMNHSISMSYSAFAGQGVAMGVYTNSMRYDFSNRLNVQVDASIVNSPYNTLGDNFTNNLNGFYLSRAALNYKPTDNTHISVQFSQMPGSYYYSPSPYYYMSPSFDRDIYFQQMQNESK